MAEPLVLQYGPAIPRKIGAMLAGAVPGLSADAFVHDALQGYDALALMARGEHIAHAMRRHLPADDAEALACVRLAAEQPVDCGTESLARFLYLPFTCYVAKYGLTQFDAALDAQHRLTQLFTAEFSIRPFLVQFPQATLDRLHQWASDPSEHVRRLVSEGSRPRLPWGQRLRAFQLDPSPVLALLVKLKDDPSLYVRRSVANNLNDIGKDHPDRVVSTMQRWLDEIPPGAPDTLRDNRRWLAAHALRSLVKAGHRGALALSGHGETAHVSVSAISFMPLAPRIGGDIRVSCTVHNTLSADQALLVDLRVHYTKADGEARPKVFKLQQFTLPAGGDVTLSKKLSLQQMTTRQHYPGFHRVELLVNGDAHPLGGFDLLS